MPPQTKSNQVIGLATTDETLVDNVGVVVRRGGAKLTIASDKTSAHDLFKNARCDVRLFDLRSVDLLPQPACGACPVLSPPSPDVVLFMRGSEACLARNAVTMYPRAELPRMLADLGRLLPGVSPQRDPMHAIIGSTPGIDLVREQIRSVARFADVSVLILGETGCGKELVAEAIHRLSHDDKEPFVAINCAAIPENLFESELFGHEADAYTGARGIRVGLLESAGSGTIFLDEIGELPQTLQPKLLRVLESKTFRRVGGRRDIDLRARVVSATNRGLSGRHAGLRPDLLFRLNGFTIVLPPLRERADDIESLAESFLGVFVRRHQLEPIALTSEARTVLRAHAWPGNVRELRAVIEHAAIVSASSTIDASHVRNAIGRSPRARSVPPTEPTTTTSLRDLERATIERAFAQNDNNLSQTARQLDMPRSTLRDKLRRYGVRS